jgi:hypothetical protein
MIRNAGSLILRYVLQSLVVSLIVVFPILILKTVIASNYYLVSFPSIRYLYANIEFLILSLNWLRWSLQIIAVVFLSEMIIITWKRFQNKVGLILSSLIVSGLVIASDYYIITSALLPLLVLVTSILWICIHNIRPDIWIGNIKQRKRLEDFSNTGENKIWIIYTGVVLVLAPISGIFSFIIIYGYFPTNILLYVASITSCICASTISYLITLVLNRRGYGGNILRYVRPIILGLVSSFIVNLMWYRPLAMITPMFFDIILFSSLLAINLIAEDCSESLVRFLPEGSSQSEETRRIPWTENPVDPAGIIFLRSLISFVILYYLLALLGIFEILIAYVYAIFLVPLSNSAFALLPEISASASHPPNLLVPIALLISLCDLCIFIVILKKTSDVEFAVQRYQRAEPLIAIVSASLFWILMLPLLSSFIFSSSIFSLVILVVFQIFVFQNMSIKEKRRANFQRWTSRDSYLIKLAVVLALMISILLHRYYAHLLLVGTLYAVGITLGIFVISALLVNFSFRIVNRLLFEVQKYWTFPQGPLLFADLIRDVLASSMVIILLQNLFSIPLFIVLPAVILLASIVSIAEHRVYDWSRIQVNGLDFFRGVSSHWKSLKKIGQILGIILVIFTATWSTVAVYEIVYHPASDVRVAVIDSGINLEDPELATHVVASKSFIETQYGYDKDDETTVDWPNPGIHGTLVAKLVLEEFPRASIINAKVHTIRGTTKSAKAVAIAAAIYWSVEEQDADVINLSLGGSSSSEEDAAIEWAWNQGVVVVTSVGNEQTVGGGATLESPADSPLSIAVAALQSDGTIFDFSSWGPPREAFMKPDIAALGNFMGSDYDRGTSYSSPRVAGAAAALIHECNERNLRWTPGLIKAAILQGASPLPYPEYMVGVGLLNLETAREVLMNAEIVDGIPFLAHLSPCILPLDIDRLFTGTEYKFTAQLTCSILTEFTIGQSNSTILLQSQNTILVNQTALIPLTLLIPDSSTAIEESVEVEVTGRGEALRISCDVEAVPPDARVAFDTSHSISSRESIYMDYYSLYQTLGSLNISVTEIRNRSDFHNFTTRGYDALLVMNPWIDNSTRMTLQEISEIRDFYENGGGVFFAPAQSGMDQNVTYVNEVINWTGISFLSNDSQYYYSLNTSSHNLTTALQWVNLRSWLLEVSLNSSILLSHGPLESGFAVMACLEGLVGRMIVAGTSSMFKSIDLRDFAINIIQWLV